VVKDRLISVALPVPALGLLTYRVPPELPIPSQGARVVVPLGSRRVTGIVVAGEATAQDGLELRDVCEVLDEEPFLPRDVVDLARWVGDYYLAGPGAALALALPPRARDGRADAFRAVQIVELTPDGREAAERNEPTRRVRQHAALQLLRQRGGRATSRDLAAEGVSAAVVARLATRGLVTLRRERVERDPFAAGVAALPGSSGPADAWRPLGIEQREAVETLSALAAEDRFHVALLHGVTGSGKTEVYLHLADAVSRRGRGVVILVPEIALTPAIAAAFRARFGNRVAVQHSGLSSGERHDQWHRIRRGEVDLVVGTRSAVFAPVARLGLIVVDEEHDTSYKQDETPRYHGRDVAVMRGSLAGALVVLGSATPSMESYYNAERARYTRVSLTRRVQDRPLSAVTIVNMREEYAAEGPEVILSRPLRAAMRARLDRREQAVVLLNRRGYAVSVFCRQCGGTIDCPNCSVSLTVHKGTHQWHARCHYCNHTRIVPRTCPSCAAPYLAHIGFGTERIEAEIRRLFPDARVGRVDRDTIRKRGSVTGLLSAFAAGELDVLVGTQMIAKGHDFPRVTLVGVVSADVGLGLADFRAAERTFQLLTQVAGRAGRGEQAGEAIVQTLFPSHYSIELATAHDYAAFYEKEIAFRRAMRYPPVVAMINVVVRGRTYDAAMEAAARLARSVEEHGRGSFTVLGPAPAPLTKLRGEHRAQLFLKGSSRRAMRTALRAALEAHPDVARRAAVDVDPLHVL
jgi:primosomal protein N' (replication factor Y)